MKRLSFLVCFLIALISSGFAQSKKIIDDIYVTPNDAVMVQEVQSAQKTVRQKPAYRNGAREIVFIDQNGNRTNVITDTVYVVDNSIDDSIANVDTLESDGEYINGFKGTQQDLEYAERIRRFHNPRYTITIADPGYNDIYFLNDNDWNVYTDGMYATITPTWTNPYWWNYNFSPFSYNSWGWRSSLYSPFGWGMGGFYDPWYSPWNSWYGGYSLGWDGLYGDYYGGYGGYYGMGYPYYGGYYNNYGWGYPYSGGGYYSGKNYNTRENGNVGRFNSTEVSGRTSATRQQAVLGTGRTSGSANPYTTVSRQGTQRNRYDAANTTSSFSSGRSVQQYRSTSTSSGRNSYSPNVNTTTRTGAVRSSDEWNATRNSNASRYSTPTRSSSGSSTVINRSGSDSRSSSGSSTYSTGTPTRSSSSSTPTYNPTRSSSSSSSTYSSGSSGSYSSGSSSSSSSSGSSGGSSSSSGSSRSGSGGRR